MPLLISVGAAIAFLGAAALSVPVFTAGLIIIAAGVAKVLKDNAQEKYVLPEEPTGETWPLEKQGKEKIGVWVFLMSEILIFGGLLTAYMYVRLSSPSWPEASQIHDPIIGMVNTIILLTSSLAMVLALYFIRAGNVRGLKIGLTSTLALGAAFLAIKLGFEWPGLLSNGFTLNSGLPASSYYALTGVHAAHVAVGLVAVGYLMLRAFGGGFTQNKHSGVEHVGLYWHFIDIVWMFLFPLFYLI
jgi:cytochrome c oxidase subunit I+III